MKRIYFAGSIRGGRGDAGFYSKIVDELKLYGTVLTEHVELDNPDSGKQLCDTDIHNRDMDWLLTSDILVAEVTTPSLGVGYEIGRAIENDIPTACLFREGTSVSLSAMIAGSTKVKVYEYRSTEGIKKLLQKIFEEI